MFYDNRNTNLIAMSLLLSATYNLKLMNNIYEAYSTIDTEKIMDVECRELATCAKNFSSDVFKNELRTPKQAQMYFETAGLPEDLKTLINESVTTLSDNALADYVAYFANIANHETLKRKMEELNKRWDKLEKSGLSKINKDTASFIESAHSIEKAITKFDRDSTTYNDFTVDVHDTDGTTTFGLDKIAEDITKMNNNRLFTGTFMDHITKGFKAESLYITCSISGGFKSGFLQNMAEEISCNMKREDFIVPEGKCPAILYCNLEMSGYQLLRRKIAFYEGDENYIINGNGEGDTLQDRLRELVKSKGSDIPVIYLTEDSTTRTYSINNLKTAIQRYEQSGFKIVGVFTDYLDKFSFDVANAPSERERDEPIVLKAYEHKDLAKEFKVPVITGAQLNTEGEKVLKDKLNRAGYEDIVKGANASVIGKARALTNVPEQIYFCYRYSVGDNRYFAIVVDKDRDHEAAYVENPDPILFDPNKEKVKVKNKRKNRGDSRVYYIVKLDTTVADDGSIEGKFRIGNNYRSTIKDFEGDMSEYEILNIDNELDDLELAEVIEDEAS